MTIVRGPAGTEKTKLLAGYAATHPEAASWVSLSRVSAPGQNPVHTEMGLVCALLTALSSGASAVQAAGCQQAASAFASGESLASSLSLVPGPGTGLLLFLDDLHVVTDERAQDALLELLRFFPLLRIIASTRSLTRFERQRGTINLDIAVIGPEELSLTQEECAAALSGTPLSADASAVWELTGGSPLWVRLLVIKAGGAPPSRSTLRSVAAAASADILRLSSPPEVSAETRSFLLATSVPESLPAELAQILHPGPETEELHRRAEMAGLLSRTPDGGGEYVPLVRDALAKALEKQDPARQRTLERTAAEFFLAQDQPLDALRHAIGADDLALVTEVLRRHAILLFTHHSTATRQELERISLFRLSRQPAPALALAVLYSSSAFRRFKGLELSALAAAAGRTLFRSMPPAEKLLLTFVEVIALRLSGQVETAAARARQGLRSYAEMPLLERERIGSLESALVSHLGITLWRAGHHAEAVESFRQAATVAAALGQPDFEGYYHSLSACMLVREGDITGAVRFLELSRALGWCSEPVHSYAETPLRLAEVMVALESLDPAAARAPLGNILADADTSELWPQIRCCEALVDLADGRPAEALSRLQGLLTRLQHLPPIGRAERLMLDTVQAHLLIAVGSPGQAVGLVNRMHKGGDSVALLFAHIQLASGLPHKTLAALAPLGLGDTPRGQAEIAALAAAAYTLADQPSSSRLVLVRLAGLHSDYGLTLATGLLPIPDLKRVRSAAMDAGLELGVPGGFAGVVEASPAPLALTSREQAILEALALTGSISEIAALNFVSTNTVKSQLRSLYRKLDVSRREEALAEAVRQGLL